MERFSFTVLVEGLDQESDRYADDLYSAGCTDALVSVSEGKLSVDFDRFSNSYQQAIDSAVSDIQRAGGKVVEIAPLTD